MQKEIVFEGDARAAIAQVNLPITETQHTRNGIPAGKTYTYRYTYTVEGKAFHGVGSAIMRLDLADDDQSGSILKIRYRAGAPNESQLVGGSQDTDPPSSLNFMLCGALTLALWYAEYRAWARRLAYRRHCPDAAATQRFTFEGGEFHRVWNSWDWSLYTNGRIEKFREGPIDRGYIVLKLLSGGSFRLPVGGGQAEVLSSMGDLVRQFAVTSVKA